ncbi:MAG: HAD family hydrolase [Ruminococcaceae bacterium]|nr:HAD family hydrolase [Oscillospiraceae bacterium]
MSIKAVLFDLDGTLIPMSQDEFIAAYFKELAKKVCPVMGISPDMLVKGIWTGTGAMIENDGSRRNDEAFWDVFIRLTGLEYDIVKPLTDDFYPNEFNNAKVVAKENSLAKKAVELAGRNGRKVVLATNPIFPMAGQVSRVHWIGLNEADFELITAYETESYCKPNRQYYLSICERIGVPPEECLMVGNDEGEDMYPASSLGMRCFNVTDYKIANEAHPWNGDSGDFTQLIEYLEKL